MNQRVRNSGMLAAALTLSACHWPFPADPPANVLAQGLLETLQDTGLYAEVQPVATIGRHFIPAEGAWRILGCFRFVTDRGEEGTSCVDSFRAYELDTGSWVVALDLNGQHRWRAISNRSKEPGPDSSDAAGGSIEREAL